MTHTICLLVIQFFLPMRKYDWDGIILEINAIKLRVKLYNVHLSWLWSDWFELPAVNIQCLELWNFNIFFVNTHLAFELEGSWISWVIVTIVMMDIRFLSLNLILNLSISRLKRMPSPEIGVFSSVITFTTNGITNSNTLQRTATIFGKKLLLTLLWSKIYFFPVLIVQWRSPINVEQKPTSLWPLLSLMREEWWLPQCTHWPESTALSFILMYLIRQSILLNLS